MKYLMTFENNRQVEQHTHQSEDRSSGPQTLERPLPGHTTSLGQLAMTKKVPQLGITPKVAFVSQSTPLNPAGLAVPSPWNPRCPKLIVGRLQITLAGCARLVGSGNERGSVALTCKHTM